MTKPVSALAEAADGLALAVIASSNSPVLLLDDALNVIAASESFSSTYQLDPSSVSGRPLSQVGDGEWAIPQLLSLLKATAAGFARVDSYELDLVRDKKMSRRLIVNARKLDYSDDGHVRLLVSIADVTDARISEKLKDDLLREKTILLQELQHRVANSLQIIASVLMQSAKKVRSEKARDHLRDARNRVMSVAEMQRQLSVSRLGDVVLGTYFIALCDSIGASMISDHDQIVLNVTADGSVAKASDSVSLGLIVTELVINALKHAFPRHRKGNIQVDYKADGPAWTLSVRDNGIGMPADHSPSNRGLGTGIVEALARQMGAVVKVENANPGTLVSIVHP
ncbi:MAG TPA: histidine kinase dimerization/phosphoacceptor domain -containing protein [Allosphingosinicella sp.]|nr:histidine kinase dimerization/phosphoacceptor domain -containing protein [Allosphingosinicella sp.]